MDSSANISRHLPAMAGRQADTAALTLPLGDVTVGGVAPTAIRSSFHLRPPELDTSERVKRSTHSDAAVTRKTASRTMDTLRVGSMTCASIV